VHGVKKVTPHIPSKNLALRSEGPAFRTHGQTARFPGALRDPGAGMSRPLQTKPLGVTVSVPSANVHNGGPGRPIQRHENPIGRGHPNIPSTAVIQRKGKLMTQMHATGLPTNNTYHCEIVIDSNMNFYGGGGKKNWHDIQRLSIKLGITHTPKDGNLHAEDSAILQVLRAIDSKMVKPGHGTVSVRITAAPCQRCAKNLYSLAKYLKRLLRIKASYVTTAQVDDDSGLEGVKFLSETGIPFRLWSEADRAGAAKVWKRPRGTQEPGFDNSQYSTAWFENSIRAKLRAEDIKKGSIPHYNQALDWQKRYNKSLDLIRQYFPQADQKWSTLDVSNKAFAWATRISAQELALRRTRGADKAIVTQIVPQFATPVIDISDDSDDEPPKLKKRRITVQTPGESTLGWDGEK
jgi:deoxycytidylate deaminase